MKQIELDIDSFVTPEDIIKNFRSKKVVKPENNIFICYSSGTIGDIKQINILIMFDAVFHFLKKDTSSNNVIEIYKDLLYKASNTFQSLSELETSLENTWHTSFEWEPKRLAKKEESPLDEIFGLWKDRNISLEEMRKNAWPERS